MTLEELETIKHLLRTGQIREDEVHADLDQVQDAIDDTVKHLPRTTAVIDGVRVTVFEPTK